MTGRDKNSRHVSVSAHREIFSYSILLIASSKTKIEFGCASFGGTMSLLLENVKPISSIDDNK